MSINELWQPIETAPSDRVVLLYSPDRGATNPARIEAREYRNIRDGTCHAWATHWMPLPDPPSDIEAGREKLTRFGTWIVRVLCGEPGDVDSDEAANAMERFGVLQRITVTEPCSKECRCAKYDDFPIDCFRIALDVEKAMKCYEGAE